MRKTIPSIMAGLVLVACSSDAPTAIELADELNAAQLSAAKGGRAGPIGTVFVTSQNLYYDTFVTVERLPMHGRFQQLVDGTTEFGPGDPGYLGGRWWVDENGNGVQDADDSYLLCPLLPPGRSAP